MKEEEALSNMLAEILDTRSNKDRVEVAERLMKWIPILFKIKLGTQE